MHKNHFYFIVGFFTLVYGATSVPMEEKVSMEEREYISLQVLPHTPHNPTLECDVNPSNITSEEPPDPIILFLLRHSAGDINAMDTDRNTVLHHAASHEQSLVMLIIDQVDPLIVNIINRDGQTALDIAIQNENSPVVKILRERGAKTAHELRDEEPDLSNSPEQNITWIRVAPTQHRPLRRASAPKRPAISRNSGTRSDNSTASRRIQPHPRVQHHKKRHNTARIRKNETTYQRVPYELFNKAPKDQSTANQSKSETIYTDSPYPQRRQSSTGSPRRHRLGKKKVRPQSARSLRNTIRKDQNAGNKSKHEPIGNGPPIPPRQDAATTSPRKNQITDKHKAKKIPSSNSTSTDISWSPVDSSEIPPQAHPSEIKFLINKALNSPDPIIIMQAEAILRLIGELKNSMEQL